MSRSETIIANLESANLIDDLTEAQTGGKHSNGRWTKEEHQRFVEAIKIYGKNWKKVEEFVATRSGAQIRSHAQKFFLRLEKELKNKQQAPQKDSRNANHAISVRKISEGSISTHHTHPEIESLNDTERSEEGLKDNLPLNEASENQSEASSLKNKRTSQVAKNISSETQSSVHEMQEERSEEKQTKNPLLDKVHRSEENLKEFDRIVNNLFTIYNSSVNNTTSTTSTTTDSEAALTRKLRPHEVFSSFLMDYFSKYNKNRQTLKLSDMVELSTEKSTSDEEAYEFPVGGKKVKQF